MADLTILIPVTTYVPSCSDGELSHEWQATKPDAASVPTDDTQIRSYECDFCSVAVEVELGDTGYSVTYYEGDQEIDVDPDEHLYVT